MSITRAICPASVITMDQINWGMFVRAHFSSYGFMSNPFYGLAVLLWTILSQAQLLNGKSWIIYKLVQQSSFKCKHNTDKMINRSHSKTLKHSWGMYLWRNQLILLLPTSSGITGRPVTICCDRKGLPFEEEYPLSESDRRKFLERCLICFIITIV